MINFIKSKSFATFVFGALSGSAFAADTLPVGGLDAGSTAKIGGASLMSQGRFGLGLNLHSANQVMRTDDNDQRNKSDLISRSTQARAMFSYGSLRWLEVSLGLAMNREQAQFGRYDELLGSENADHKMNSSEATKEHESGFAGAIVSAKIGVLQDGLFKLAVAPFFESGAGKSGEMSLTRSSKAKGGWMVMTTLGDKGLAEVDMNLGYRYREPERIGTKLLRNEFIYQGLVRGYLNRNFGVFAGGQGRMISISEDDDRDFEGSRRYRAVESGELSAGLSVALDDIRVDFYGGKSPQSQSIGHGQTLLGVNLAMTLGSKRRTSLADQVAPSPAKQQPIIQKVPDDDHLVKPAKLDPIAPADFDLFSDVEKMLANEMESGSEAGDFRPLPEKKVTKEKAPPAAGAEVDRVERELEAIRAAEEKIAEEDAKRRIVEEEMDRRQRRKEFDERQKTEESYRKEMRQRIEVFPSVTDEDYGWSGLED